MAWIFFGLNGFFHFLSAPPPVGDAGTYFEGLMASGYVFPVISAIELAAGVLLVAGRFVPLALLLLAPILVNILAYHVVLDLKGIGVGAVFTVMVLFLAWVYRSAFKGVLAATHQFDAVATAPPVKHDAAPNAMPA